MINNPNARPSRPETFAFGSAKIVCPFAAIITLLTGWALGLINPAGTLRFVIQSNQRLTVELAAREESGAIVRRQITLHPDTGNLVWAGPRFKKSGTVHLTLRGEKGSEAVITQLRIRRPGFITAKSPLDAPQRVDLREGKQRLSFDYQLEREQGKWAPLRESFIPSALSSMAFALAGWGVGLLCLKRRHLYAAIKDGLTASPAFACGALIAATLTAAMALSSRPNAHPDERWHFNAAAYFQDAWRLPARNSPECIPSISLYGYSYLWTSEPVYPVLGNFMRLASFAFADSHPLVLTRMFQVALFVVCLVACLIAKRWFLGMSILCSSQMWYLFSYVNGDAFAIAAEIMLLLCALNLWAEKPRAALPWLGVASAMALIFFSKKTAWFSMPIAVFAIVSALGQSLREASHQSRRVSWRSPMIGLALFLALAGLLSVYAGQRMTGSQPDVVQSVFETPKKPTPEQAAKLERTVRLREKDVGLSEMLLKRKWLEWSAASAFGVYGWMTVWQRPWFYVTTWLLFLGMILCGLIGAWRTGRGTFVGALVCLGSFAALIAAAAWWSWIVDFQPQGRYWLAGFPLIGVVLEIARARLPCRMVRGLWLSLLILALYSFCFGGLALVDEIAQKELL